MRSVFEDICRGSEDNASTTIEFVKRLYEMPFVKIRLEDLCGFHQAHPRPYSSSFQIGYALGTRRFKLMAVDHGGDTEPPITIIRRREIE